jgi:hypothetical protein
MAITTNNSIRVKPERSGVRFESFMDFSFVKELL